MKQQIKPTDIAKRVCGAIPGGHWLRRLVRCCRSLGWWQGIRCWRLENMAIRDPFMALLWASEIRYRVDLEEARGDKVSASLLRCFATEMVRPNKTKLLKNLQTNK